ncbi:MAG TPA: cysteine hydrolase [Candidatus Aquilonibacter sp.]
MSDSISPVDPARTILLVMDYQTGILGMVADPDALVARAADAIAKVRYGGGHVGFVRVAFIDADYAAIPERNKGFSAAKASGRNFSADSPATAIDQRIAPKDGDVVVRKTRVGAFSTTGLAEQLAQRGIDTLILAGISTSGVVLSTIRDAADHDYRLLVIADACADPQADVHTLLLEKVFPRQADVITIADLDAVLATAS